MVSNLFSIRFDDSNSPSTQVVVAGRDVPVREYVVGPENALLSHVVSSEGNFRQYAQPVLLFGAAGIGKTHLIRGLVEQYQSVNPEAATCLRNGADFVRDFSQAQEDGSLTEVRQAYHQLDCLAIDDLHALSDKPYAQQELQQMLEALGNRRADVLLTSRTSPAELPFSAALKSRLHGGLTIPIAPPGNPTRANFVRQFANENGLDLPDAVIAFLAELTPMTIPELRGLVLQIQQTHLDESLAIDIELVSKVVQQRVGTDVPGVREIIKKVARYFGLTVAELTGPSRRQTTVLARDTAIFLTRQLRQDSFEQIGTYFGGRDHSTVMHAFQKICKKRDDVLVNAAIVELAQRLGMQSRNL